MMLNWLCVLFSLVNVVLSQCRCNHINGSLYLQRCDAGLLSNNSAISVSKTTSVLCCTEHSGTAAVWYNKQGNSPSTDANAIVHINSPYELVAHSLFSAEYFEGIYTCRIINDTTNATISELFLGLYYQVGLPSLSDMTLSIIEYYPLIVKLSIDTSGYSLAQLSWSNDGVILNETSNCVLTKYTHLTNKDTSTYTNVLILSDSNQTCILNGTYTVNASSDGKSYFASTNQSIGIASTPQNVTFASLNKTQVIISWNPSMEVDTIYHIVTANKTIMTTNVSNISVPVINDTSYTLILFSLRNYKYCLPSKPKNLFFKTTIPFTPSDFSMFTLDSTSVQINWTMFANINIPVDQVIIKTTDNCSNLPTIYTLHHIDLESHIVLNSLQPGTEYCFQVYAKNSWGESNRTEALCTNTSLNEISAPSGSPTIINTTNTTCNNNTVSWNHVNCNARNGPFSHYLVQLYDGLHCNPLVHSVETTESFLNISDFIRPYSNYCVRIARVNIGGLFGPYSQMKSAMTTSCISDKIRDFVVRTTTTTARLSWKPPTNVNGRFENYCLVVNGTALSQSCNKTSTDNETIYDNLYPDVEHTFLIGTINSVGLGPLVQVNATTKPIERIDVLSVDWANESHVTVTWREAHYSNEIASYIINYAINEISNTTIVSAPATSWTFNISMRSSIYEYTFSVLATVKVNGIEIKGKVNGTVITGCYGDCSSIQVGGVVGGTITGIFVFLSVIVILIIITVVCNKRSLKQSETKLVPLNQVMGGSMPVLISKSGDITVNVGEDVVMKVEVSGDPLPVIIWYYDNKIIADDNHFELENENELVIHKIAWKHAGVYQFTASNSLGTVDGQIRVFVQREDEPIEQVDFPHTEQSHVEECVNVVPLEKWAEHVEAMKEGSGFKDEFQKLQTYNFLSTETASSSENRRKNRFKTVLPYDTNLVKLKSIPSRGDCNHSYINASYIDGHTRKKQFIATQGPLPQTLIDFWRLVWQEDICCIVMLLSRITEGGTIIRCQQYWPDSGAVAYYGPFKITVERVEDHVVYKERQMLLARTDDSHNSSKVIYHYQFNCWPEDGVPKSLTPILTLYEAIKMWTELPTSPTLVHCSAGVGRTAVLLAIIIGIEQGQKEKKIDVMSIVNKLRVQRMNMVQTEEQYAFIHRALLQAFYCKDTGNITAANFGSTCNTLESVINEFNMTGYQAHFKALQVLSVKPNRVLRNGGLSFPTLSRSKRFLPPDNYRVVLDKRLDDDKPFIHASYLDGYKQDKAFIVAESPTKVTTAHFWQMIMEQRCSVIVMLCDCVEKGEDVCFPYWPAFSESEKRFDDFHITHHQQFILTEYTETMFKVVDSISKEECSVTLLQIPNWAPNGEYSDPRSILTVINRVENIQRKTGNNPIVVHCSDTVTRTGIFCTLYIAIQQMKTEQLVNIYEILTNLRAQKPGLVVTPDHYKMVYDLLHFFLREFDTYGNFSSCPNLLA